MRRSFVVTAIVGIGVSCLAFNPIQQTQNTLSSGLVAAYSFSEGTGSSTADVSGNKNNFTLTSMTWSASGHTGYSLVNASSGQGMVSSPSPQLSFTKAFTMMIWVYPTSDPGSGEHMVVAYDNPDAAYGIEAFDYSDASGKPICFFNDGTAYRITAGTAKLALNTWTHLTCTYDGSILKIYSNGALQAFTAYTTAAAATGGHLSIGSDSSGGYTGRLDDLRLFNRPLILSEIVTLMNSPVNP